MKRSFREYHDFTDGEMGHLWEKAIVVLDTNVLLDFYCFGKETLEDYYTVLREVKKRGQLWMPYQVGFEFFENRVGIISKQLNQYDSLLTYLDATKQKIAGLTNSSPNHAHLDFNEIAQNYEKAVKPIKGRIEKLQKVHPDHLGDDKVLAELEKIFDDTLVGLPYDNSRLEEVAKEGEERYTKKIPPGFKDQDKKEDENEPSRNRKYGDLIIWKQMIEKAKTVNKPIIFVTNDAKDDWVLYAKDGRKLGAKPLLKKEMLAEAKVDFALYSSDEFLDFAHKKFKLTVKAQSVDEVKKYRELEIERINSIRHYEPTRNSLKTSLKRRLYLEELHTYLHRSMKISRDAEKHDLSRGAERSLSRLRDIYEDMHRMVDRSTERPLEALFYLERMLVRSHNIIRDLAVYDVPAIEELDHLNRKMLSVIESDQL